MNATCDRLSQWTPAIFVLAVVNLVLGLFLSMLGLAWPAVAPVSLAMVHLLIIGWLTLLMFSALFQFVPVITSRPPPSQALPLATLIGVESGLALMVGGFCALCLAVGAGPGERARPDGFFVLYFAAVAVAAGAAVFNLVDVIRGALVLAPPRSCYWRGKTPVLGERSMRASGLVGRFPFPDFSLPGRSPPHGASHPLTLDGRVGGETLPALCRRSRPRRRLGRAVGTS